MVSLYHKVCWPQVRSEMEDPIYNGQAFQFSYYSQFIPHYADMARLLHQDTCKAAPDRVVWCNELIQCFRTLQSSLTSNSLLTLPTLSDEFLLQTDASGVGLGAVLSVVREGKEKELPVAFWSRSLNDREKKYSVSEPVPRTVCLVSWSLAKERCGWP